MPDWRTFVREHLGSASAEQVERKQIANELAGHLEEHYENLRAQGTPEALAFEQTCARAGNLEELRREIISARQEETMTDRVRQVWIPTLVTLVLSGVVLAILGWAKVQPITWHVGEARGIILNLPWLLSLPLAGGIGAYLSRRAQGSGWCVYASGLSPALAWGIVFVLVAPFAFFVNPAVAPSFKITSILAMAISWVILPAVALAIGVMAEGMRKVRPAAKV